MDKRQAYLILATMMLVSMLSTAGIALPYPILAPLFIDYAANPLNSFAGLHPKILLAIVLAVYPLGMLIGSSFIGALSDVYGRKRTLIITQLCSVLGYLVTALALVHHDYLLFVAARLITGIFEGNIAIARAIAADLHPIVDKTRAFSWLYASMYGAWFIGPLAGGYLMQVSPEAAFYVAALSILISAVFTWLLIKESPRKNQHNRSLWQNMVKQNSLGLLQNPPIKRIIFAYFLMNLGLNAFYEFYPLWLVDVFSFSSIEIGHITAVLTLFMVIASAFIVERAKHKYGKINTILLSLSILACAFMAIPLIQEAQVYWYFAATGVLIALYNGLVPVYVSDRYDHMGQGRILGLLTTTFFLANTLIALIGGALSLLGSQWSIAFGGVLMMSGMMYLFHFDRSVPPPEMETSPAPVNPSISEHK